MRLFAASIATLCAFGSATWADTAPARSDWRIGVGIGTALEPDYEGSDDYRFRALPLLDIVWRDLVFVRGLGVGVNALTVKGPGPEDRLHIGPIARYRFGRDADDNSALRGLGDVNDSVEGGGFIQYRAGPWSLGLTLVHDLSGSHEGALAEVRTGYVMPLGERLRADFGASATWASDNYMQTYFGITTAQAAASGRAAYNAASGFKDAGLSVGLNYALTAAWSVGGRVRYTHLLGDAANSPIVAQDGDASQIGSTLFLNYRF